jgi:hypothetical protein
MQKRLTLTFFYLLLAANYLFAQASYLSNETVNLFAGGGDGSGGSPLTTAFDAYSVASDPLGDIFVSGPASSNPNQYNLKKISNGTATDIVNFSPNVMAADQFGDLFFYSYAYAEIFEYTTAGQTNVIAGNGTLGYTGDGGAATNAEIGKVTSIAIASTGELFFVDTANLVVREITTDGNIKTFASSPQYYSNTYVGVMSGQSVCIVSPIGVYIYDFSGNLIVNGAPNASTNIMGIATNPTSNSLYEIIPGNKIYSTNSINIFNNTFKLYAGNGTTGKICSFCRN